MRSAARISCRSVGAADTLQAYPGHLPAMMGAASLALRTRIEDERLEAWLAEIALRAEEPRWREWALAQAARREGR